MIINSGPFLPSTQHGPLLETHPQDEFPFDAIHVKTELAYSQSLK